MHRRAFIAGVGSAAAWPSVARGQQPAMPVIGYLSGWSPGDAVEYLDYFRQGLDEAGYAEGRNVKIEYRFAEGHFDRLAVLVDDLVRRQVNVIAVPNTTAAAIAAKAATKDIPIVFSLGSNPVEVGIVASLNHPGGNLTGLTALQTAVMGKRLELLHELMPAATAIALLVNPANQALAEADTREAQATADVLGVNLLVLKASSPSEIDEAFLTVVREKAGALLTNSESYFMIQRDRLSALAVRHFVPALYAYRENTAAGGLMSYGANFLNPMRDLGLYVGRILKGERPANLPVQQSTKVELVLNLKTAKTLAITFPPSLLARADEVIE